MLPLLGDHLNFALTGTAVQYIRLCLRLLKGFADVYIRELRQYRCSLLIKYKTLSFVAFNFRANDPCRENLEHFKSSQTLLDVKYQINWFVHRKRYHPSYASARKGGHIRLRLLYP